MWSGGTEREGISRKAGLGFMFAYLFVGNLFFVLFCFGGAYLVTAFKFMSHKYQMWFLFLLSNVHHGVLKGSVMSHLVS